MLFVGSCFAPFALSSSWLPLIIARRTILLLFHLFSFYLQSESGGGGGEQCLFLFRFMHQLACFLKGWKSSLLAAWAVFWEQYLRVFCNHCSININVLICLPKEVFHFLVIRKCCAGSSGLKTRWKWVCAGSGVCVGITKPQCFQRLSSLLLPTSTVWLCSLPTTLSACPLSRFFAFLIPSFALPRSEPWSGYKHTYLSHTGKTEAASVVCSWGCD